MNSHVQEIGNCVCRSCTCWWCKLMLQHKQPASIRIIQILLVIQWVPLNIIPSVHEKIMTISGIFSYPMYSYYRGYRGIIGPV